MAITARSLAQLHELRAEVGRLTDDAARTVAEAWLAAWERLSPAWQAALAAVVDNAARTGRWPSSWQLARIPEVASAASATDQAGVTLGAATGTAVVAAVGGIVAATLAAEPLILAAQLPAAAAATAASRFAAKVSPTAAKTVHDSFARRINDATRTLGTDAPAAVGRALVRGLPAAPPPTSPVGLLDRLRATFHQVAARAITTAQTETFDAYRAATSLVHAANADAVAEWVWVSSLDSRSCPSCWAMHGTTHPLSEPGPHDHPRGRCVRLVRLKPWPVLGVVGDEPADVIPDAQARFRKLSRADQVAVMGTARLRMLDQGEIGWADLAVHRTSRGWRDSYAPRALTELRRIAGHRTT